MLDGLPGLWASLEERGVITADSSDEDRLDAFLDLFSDRMDIFGYGSLPDSPTYVPGVGNASAGTLNVTPALMAGWRRDFCCGCSRSGTNTDPGLVLGVEPDATAEQAGAILSYEGLSLPEMTNMIYATMEREKMVVRGELIYKFVIQDVEDETGAMRPSLVCVADTDAPGNFSHLEFEDRAAQIACATNAVFDEDGNLQPECDPDSERYSVSSNDIRTSKSYFDRFVGLPMTVKAGQGAGNHPGATDADAFDTSFAARYQAALAADEQRMRAYETAIDEARRRLPADRQQQLSEVEHMQAVNYLRKLRVQGVSSEEIIEAAEALVDRLAAQLDVGRSDDPEASQAAGTRSDHGAQRRPHP